MKEAQKYLLDIGFDEAHLPELFNDDDKSTYTIPELMEGFAKSQPKWVSVEDRLPEQKKQILIIEDDSMIEMGEYSGAYFIEYYGEELRENVTHWMHLPAAPQTKQL